MGISDAITSLKALYETFNKLRELSNDMKNVELKTTIAKMANELADVQMQFAELKLEFIRLKEENDLLKTKKTEEKPIVRGGCYYFDGDDNPYCPGCYSTTGKKCLVVEIGSFIKCSACNRTLGGPR